MNTKLSFVLSTLFTLLYTSSAAPVYNVVQLGARPDGKTDPTKSFLDAWASACTSAQPATIYVPRGRYLLKNVVFKGNCKNIDITFRIDGTLVAPPDYNVLGNSEKWLSSEGVTGVSIYGGTLDGRGAALWTCKTTKKNCPQGATIFHIVINGYRNVNMKGVMITAPGNSPNTDGIHDQLSTGVTIMNSGIKTGDDCISIGPGTENLWMENIACGPGHGISIGSLAKELDEPGVLNVTVKTVVFTNAQNGLRIKAWGRPSNGFVKGVLFQHAVMKNVENPIVIDQNYCPRNENCPDEVSGIKINEVTYEDIEGSSATQVAVKFDCSNTNPCKALKLVDVKLTYQNQPALSSCTNAVGSTHGFVQPNSCL